MERAISRRSVLLMGDVQSGSTRIDVAYSRFWNETSKKVGIPKNYRQGAGSGSHILRGNDHRLNYQVVSDL